MDMQELQEKIAEHEKFRPILSVRHEDRQVHYLALSRTMFWRIQSLHSKEPDTLQWIAGFRPDDVLVDIGANVGMYTIWAAVTRGCRVFAFEPESQNFAMLNANLLVNKLSDQVRAYCMALSDETAFDVLNLGEFLQGGSNHTFRENLNFQLETMDPVFRQGCYATTLDALVEQGVVPVPQHIKIDVDGIEHRVVNGMARTLRDPAVRSVLIEINGQLEIHRKIIEDMREAGYDYVPEEVEASVGRQKGTAFEGIGNYVFYRQG